MSLGVGGLSLAVLVGLASRPLWMIARRGTDTARHQFTNDVVGSFQRAAGFDIDPTRTYAESTVTWLSFYLTWPLVVAAMLGIAVLTYRMARGSWRLAVPIVGLAVPSLLYLVRPSIVPDQIWAIRRLEPATVPLFVLGAVVFLWALAALVRRPAWRITMWGSLAMLVLIISTWVTISPGSVRPVEGSSVIGITELDGARAQLDELCAIEPGRPIVLVGQSAHFGSLRVMCDVPVVLALQDPSRQSLVEMTEVWGTAPLVLTTRADAVEWTAPPQIVVDSIVKQTEFALQSLPTVYYSRSYQWFAGIPGADGVVVPEELPAAAVEVSEP